jgi:hypothetical protein
MVLPFLVSPSAADTARRQAERREPMVLGSIRQPAGADRPASAVPDPQDPGHDAERRTARADRRLVEATARRSGSQVWSNPTGVVMRSDSNVANERPAVRSGIAMRSSSPNSAAERQGRGEPFVMLAMKNGVSGSSGSSPPAAPTSDRGRRRPRDDSGPTRPVQRPGPHSRSRSPDARWTTRLTAARTAASDPMTVTCRRARVTPV